jgi:hypothetical protein
MRVAAAASHIRRGSKVSAAKMVMSTTAQKATAPTAGLDGDGAAELHQRRPAAIP